MEAGLSHVMQSTSNMASIGFNCLTLCKELVQLDMDDKISLTSDRNARNLDWGSVLVKFNPIFSESAAWMK